MLKNKFLSKLFPEAFTPAETLIAYAHLLVLNV